MLHLFNQTKIASISYANSIFQVYGPVQTWYLHSSSEIPSQVDSFKLACSKNTICVPVDQMLFLPSELTHVSDPVPLNVETLRTCVGAFRPVLNTDHLGWDHLGEMLQFFSIAFTHLTNHGSTSSNAHIFFAQQESSLVNGLTISHCFHANFFEF